MREKETEGGEREREEKETVGECGEGERERWLFVPCVFVLSYM